MAEYIDKTAFLTDIESRYCDPCQMARKDCYGATCRACWVADMMGEVEDAPAADVVSVVRCKDCVVAHKDPNGSEVLFWCDYMDGYVHKDDFCSDGERKDADA